jgi:Flp pilus assembly pilin Flp
VQGRAALLQDNIGRGVFIMGVWQVLLRGEEGQDVAEYAVMLSIIVMIALATVRFIGSGADHTFSAIASTIR